MNSRLLIAALAATGVACLAPPAFAGCVIAPDGKSINVVTDNGSSDQKTCSVACKVDTKIGVVQIGCGGTTPPLAKGHSLCDYDKPEAYYKKVISSEDSCKGASAAAAPAPPVAAAPALKPGGFTCRISPDGKTVDAVIVNPYKVETSCHIDCSLSTTKAGTTFSLSCGRPAAPGVETVMCSHNFEGGKVVKMLSGKGDCVDQTPKPAAADKDDDEDELSKTKGDPDKVDEFMRKQMEKAQKMKSPNAKQESAEDLQKMMDDPDKMDEYIRKQMEPK
jgi:hypothetical protein